MSEGATYCRTELQYSTRSLEATQGVNVSIGNGRQALAELPFVESGFTLLSAPSQVKDWRDEQQVARVHRSEIEQLARQQSGCEEVLVYPPLVRSPDTARHQQDYAPIEFVHSDFTDDYRSMISSPERPYHRFIEKLLGEKQLTLDALQTARRIVMLQFWRNIGALRPDYPLALCDARTVSKSQLTAFLVPEYGGEPLAFETFAGLVPENPSQHAWYTFPDLCVDEVVMLRTYDSELADSDQAFWTLHSAFRDPNVPDPAPRRESVEMRALCLFL